MARLESVNIGAPTVQPGSRGATGIVKVPRTGPAIIDTMGLLGDAVMDKKHHGGVDQAVYIYLSPIHHKTRALFEAALLP